MLRLLVTVLVVYLVLLLLQATICRGVNGAIMGGYWWMCGDVPAKQAGGPPSNPLQSLIQGLASGSTGVINTGQQVVGSMQSLVSRYDYFPAAGLCMPLQQAEYVYANWCWKGVL